MLFKYIVTGLGKVSFQKITTVSWLNLGNFLVFVFFGSAIKVSFINVFGRQFIDRRDNYLGFEVL